MPRSKSGTTEPRSVSEQLRLLRLDKKWSLSDLHHAVERSISVPYLSRIELGGALPRAEKLEVIGTALEADVDALLRQRDQEALVRLGIDPEVAELALTLRELDNERCRKLVGELATALKGTNEKSRERLLRTLTEAIAQLGGDEAGSEYGGKAARSRGST